MLKMKTKNRVSELLAYTRTEKASVLVCVTNQKRCRRLIEQGAQIARQKDMNLLVLSVQPNEPGMMSDCDALEYLFSCSMDHNAQMSVYFSNDIWGTANAYIRRQRVEQFVVGVPHEGGDFVNNLISWYPGVNIAIVENNLAEVAV